MSGRPATPQSEKQRARSGTCSERNRACQVYSGSTVKGTARGPVTGCGSFLSLLAVYPDNGAKRP
jgi:hypothetical protein